MSNQEKEKPTGPAEWLVISDVSLEGSGYTMIVTNTCQHLAKVGVPLRVLGLNYDGRPHRFDYPIVPIRNYQDLFRAIQIHQHHNQTLGLIVMLDIPLHIRLLQQFAGQLPYLAVFPVESAPLCTDWAMAMAQARTRLVMSRTGQQALAAYGIDSTLLPIGVSSPDDWTPAELAERQMIREALGVEPDEFLVVSVADNQERKNLSALIEIFGRCSVEVIDRDEAGLAINVDSHRKTKLILVTRPKSPIGWDLDDLAMRTGVLDRCEWISRGASQRQLRDLLCAADCFLLTSKAEGLAIPVMEAMATKTPVLTMGHAAMGEHAAENRALIIETRFRHIDPFGNGERVYADIEDGAYLLSCMADGTKVPDVEAAYQYVINRTWQQVADIIQREIENCGQAKEQQAQTETQPTGVFA